jgi:hypothetical protein
MNEKMLIAQEVINLIDNNQVSLTLMNYFKYVGPVDRDGDLSQVIGKGCRVCAIGALLVAKAKLFDQCPVRDHISLTETNYLSLYSEDCIRLLSGYFDSNELKVIEAAFELYDTYPKARLFGLRYIGAAGRLKAIMENVLKFGSFKPEET